MSLISPTVSFPQGAARSAFAAAARSFDVARQTTVAAPLDRVPGGAPSVQGAIANAARQTGVDFDFLLAQAQVESALNPAAKARTSSASGLYQFIDSTWLDTMRRHGARFGLGGLADAIQIGSNGAAYVADPARRAEILSLRNDPQVAAWMAASLAEDNAGHLMPILGRQPDHGELYLAHFLGAGGAGRFLAALQNNPQQGAAGLFAKAAAANPSIFYDADGTTRSLAGVMRHLNGKIQHAMGLGARAADPPVSPALKAPAVMPAASSVPGDRPYLIADETVFLPDAVPLVTAGALPGRTALPAPMSEVLGAAFGATTERHAASPRAQAQVRRAYQHLKAFGL